jgi:hypothetical protein
MIEEEGVLDLYIELHPLSMWSLRFFTKFSPNICYNIDLFVILTWICALRYAATHPLAPAHGCATPSS